MKTTYLKMSFGALILTTGLVFTSCGAGNMGGDASKSEGGDATYLNVPVNTNQHTSSDMNITPSDYTNSPENRTVDTLQPKTEKAPN